MDRKKVFRILEIEETKEEEKIKAAYLAHLKHVNPEDDPEGFKRLREAYETAIMLSHEKEEKEPKDEISLWLDRVDEVYQDIQKRICKECWRDVFSDPILKELDTCMEASNRFIGYLMQHIYMPQKIWQVIDEEIHILENIEELKHQFPSDFLKYVVNHIRDDSFFVYEYFDVLEEEKQDTDTYIEEYMPIKNAIDRNEMETLEEPLNALDKLADYGVYHPYEDVERVRCYLKSEEIEKAGSLVDKLLEHYRDNVYILIYSGQVRWEQEREEEAKELWEKALEFFPNSYPARRGLVKYYFRKEEYEKAKDIALDLLDENEEDEEILSIMHESNEILIANYRKQIEDGEADDASYLALGWCLLQNDKMDEAIEWIQSFTPSEEKRCEYHNLCGRILFTKGDYKRAFSDLKEWLSTLEEIKEKDPEDKRLARLGLAYYMIGCCLFEEKKYKESEEMFRKACDFTTDNDDKLSYLNQLARAYLTDGENKKCVDICDEILSQDEGYYPAYLLRQEAFYNLDEDQQVVDDYYRAIEIYAGYYKPYLLAEKVFFYHDQYEEAKRVLDRARENQVELSDQMRLYEVKILRNLSENKKARKEPMAICMELLKAVRNEDTDIEDKSEVNYEIGLLHWANKKYKKAIEHLKTAIHRNPDRMQYHLILGDIYRETESFRNAIQQYELASTFYKREPRLYYFYAYCYERMGQEEQAIEKYKKVLELDETFWDANLKLADIYLEKYHTYCRKEDFQAAIFYMDKEVEDEQSCYNYVHRGMMHMDGMEIEEAIADYERALVVQPDDWAAHNNIGYSCKVKGDYKRAIEMLTKAAEILKKQKRKSPLPYGNMAACYEILDDYENAILCHKKTLELFPEKYSIWDEIGDLYYEMDNYEEALKAYEEARKNPRCRKWEYLDDIGDVYYIMGDIEKCIECYADAIRKAKGERADRWNNLGYLYLIRLKDYQKALKCFKIALACGEKEEDPDQKNYLDSLAELYFRMGDKENSRKYAKLSLEGYLKNFDSEEVYVSYGAYRPGRCGIIGRLYLYMGEDEKALSYFAQMESCCRCKHCSNIACYESHMYRGLYYESKGKDREALEEYKKAQEINKLIFKVNIAIEEIEKRLS